MAAGFPFIEVERKFLVRADTWRERVSGTELIRQSYLTAAPGITTRVRQIGDRTVLTYKTARIGISRGEIEIPITAEVAAWLFAVCPFPAIEKQRHLVTHGEATWEIDVFLGRHQGLVVAEIEMAHPFQPVDLPDWIGKEVTHDAKFKNSRLYRATPSELKAVTPRIYRSAALSAAKSNFSETAPDGPLSRSRESVARSAG